ncbi:putative tetratricopeptide-like helical domain superfamily, pentacotripeptide-repeat region of PRORP [Helianthus annuus]|nr:putative tetratricopeptide-like helical domain superfamily, pentacotripeptide-repeat region of PRORP [Helianthus annuus]
MSHDIIGMEQVLETMKAEGLEPDSRLQSVLARQYVYAGMNEKARAVLNEMEGSNLSENRGVYSSLLQIYALLGSVDDVKRVWEACETNPRLEECMNAIEAFGKLKNVAEAEAVFDLMSKKWNRLSAKYYTSMLKVYANNKMLLKGKEIVKQMSDSGCRLGPLTWDALVKLYIESGEIEKADSILNKASQQLSMKPLFSTYMLILDEYAKKGDVHNAEKIFYKMRQVGYVSRYRQYDSLLQAYINAKAPLYGFRERLKADNVFPSKTLAERLAQVDAFKKTAVSDLLD